MRRLLPLPGFALLLSFALLAAAAPAAGGATDPRFFGTYCGDDSIRVCFRYRSCFFLGWPCRTGTRCETLAIRNARVDIRHREGAPGYGIVEGQGTARVNDRNLQLAVHGHVASRGRARGLVTSNLFNPHGGLAVLSADGVAVTVYAMGDSITLRKDRCGNQAPTVRITSPGDGTVVPFGDTAVLAAEITDEDASFPEARMGFRSNRDGPLTGYAVAGAKSLSLFTRDLSPGAHTITFAATDSGGLSASTSVRVRVENQAPDAPTILEPSAASTLVATGPMSLQGRAYDREDGILSGSALRWSLFSSGSPAIELLGTGRALVLAIANPGTYTLRLTAVDSVGATRSTERTIHVQPYTGNTPPRVRITVPDHLATLGIAMVAGDEISFLGAADDLEDAPGTLSLEWTAEPTNPTGPASTFGTAAAATTTLSSLGGHTTEYTITFKATDSGGLVGSTSFKIYIIPHPIY